MSSREILQSNLEELLDRDPLLVLHLEEAVPHPCAPFPYAEEWFSSLSLEKVDVLYIYGASPEVYRAAQSWLRTPQERYLIFLEDDLSSLAGFLSTPESSELLRDPMADLRFFANPQGDEELFERLSWQFIMGNLAFAALPDRDGKREISQALEHRLRYDAAVKYALIDEYLHYGVPFFRNVYPNLLLLKKSFWGPGFFGQAKEIPAIICGAGPSLTKQVSSLSLLKDRALIFAGGSSLNGLLSRNFVPHFGAGIDPNPEQEERIRKTCHIHLPFFFRLRMHHRALSLLQGPLLYIPGSGGYDIGEWMDESLGIPEGDPIEEGHNVVHFCTDIARALGCNPIIYIGLDLAFTGEASYAEGIAPHQPSESTLDDREIQWKDWQGRPVRTLWKWIAEADWLGKYAEEHPQIRMINATEGGIGIPGIPNRTLLEVAEELCQRSFPLEEWIQEFLEESPMPAFLTEEKELLVRLKESLARCEQQCIGILEEAEKIKEKIERGSFSPVDLQTGRSSLLETDLVEEEGYRAVLDVFAMILNQLLQREQIRIKRKNLPEREEHLERLEISRRRFEFLRDTAKIHQQMIAHSLDHAVPS